MKKNIHKIRNRKTNSRTSSVQNSLLDVDNTEDIDAVLTKNKLFGQMLGLSDENLFPLYSNAIGMLQAQSVEDAIASFSFLIKINPYVPEFWVGLGLSHKAAGDFSSAFNALLVALTMDPLLVDAYEYAIDCCIEKEKYNQAEMLVDQLFRALRHCHSRQEMKLIQQQAKKLEEKIALKKPH